MIINPKWNLLIISNLEEVCHDHKHRETMRDDCKHHNLVDKLKCTCQPWKTAEIKTNEFALIKSYMFPYDQQRNSLKDLSVFVYK